MRFAYFDYFGRPAPLEVDDDDIPQRCEIYDEEKSDLVQNDRLTLDVWATSGSSLISEAAYDELLAKCRKKAMQQQAGKQ